ncbi:DUF159-domain-containing protein [Trichoderma reesei RUT C-30]|uniref:DUF159-domain-containing protein n=2 Tax=Hypocrea jecorina TaxID=51453 RepID=A0A024S7X5_HYPJR|nr:DUF159-domain-containing protein [Trichoderma reesei RUT C-30]
MLEDDGIQITDSPDDQGPEAPYQTYNFSPGSNGIVCVADTFDQGAGLCCHGLQNADKGSSVDDRSGAEELGIGATKYRLRTMKWGITPSWSKKKGASVPKAINCRDDSLRTHGGMWQGMKNRKRCVVVAQGFFEWLNVSTKEKIPHFVKRKDGRLMCFAGLWDSIGNEDTGDKTYTYAIITTNSNKQLRFLHHRMPVILDTGSKELQEWLHPSRRRWTDDLQSLLKPYRGDLDIYPVSKDVGKVGRSSPSFIKPLNDKGREHDIARFFSTDARPDLAKGTDVHKKRKISGNYNPPTKRSRNKQGPAGVQRITDFFG